MVEVPEFLTDPMFWVQFAVAVGTIGLAAVTAWMEWKRRRDEDANRAADSVALFVAPAFETVTSIHGLSQPQSDPYRPGLADAANDLWRIRLHSTRKAYDVPGELLARLEYVRIVALDVANQLGILQRRARHVLDDIGSELSGDVGRREYPQVEIRQDGKVLGTLSEAALVECWLKRMRFIDLLDFIVDEFDSAAQTRITLRHGNQSFDDGPRMAKLEKILYQRMKTESAIEGLPDRLRELRIESERVKTDLGRLVATLSDKARA